MGFYLFPPFLLSPKTSLKYQYLHLFKIIMQISRNIIVGLFDIVLCEYISHKGQYYTTLEKNLPLLSSKVVHFVSDWLYTYQTN